MSAPAKVEAAWRTGPLASRNFRLLAAGQFTSTVGDFCYAVALPWLVLSAPGSAGRRPRPDPAGHTTNRILSDDR